MKETCPYNLRLFFFSFFLLLCFVVDVLALKDLFLCICGKCVYYHDFSSELLKNRKQNTNLAAVGCDVQKFAHPTLFFFTLYFYPNIFFFYLPYCVLTFTVSITWYFFITFQTVENVRLPLELALTH